ncbi:MAG TPA: hypothetical protein IAB40_04155 [Candidatus Onthocola stercoravium]|nr:hypothetical protein [Candidatus Onthocola stercoravium]
MSVYGEFFTKFMEPFFEGLLEIVKGIGRGLGQMFNVVNYVTVVNDYKSDLTGVGTVIMILSIILLLALFAVIIFLIYRAVRTYVRYRRNVKKEDRLIEEIEVLNNEILKLKRQNAKIAELTNENGEIEYDEEGNVKNELKEGESRFFKLSSVDAKFKEYTPEEIHNNFTLQELCDLFRNFSASKLGLYYDINLIRLFIASFASNKLIILEGISGTGKTSLAYAFGEFTKNETTVASVQPSWRDSTEIFGYFNEFTKKFNETEILEKMYEAQYTDEVYITLLDEMNISRVEYYFAEMLSILELPNKKDWVVELVPNVWPGDPEKLDEGKLKIPENMWYVGTINNDDSTFMITDKVYDRAMPIAIDDKCEAFGAPDTDAVQISYKYFEGLFDRAEKEHPVTDETLEKVAQLDRYVIDHFRLAFGNRIVKQLREFVPSFVACGGDEVAGIDYLIAHKILRKFEQLNLAYIKDEIDGLINYLEKLFGTGKTPECKAYLLRLKKTI